MCHYCDSWEPNITNRDGYDFCSEGCLQAYLDEETKRKRDQVEALDRSIEHMKRVRSGLLKELGEESSYSWTRTRAL
jgi:hypothetical protein